MNRPSSTAPSSKNSEDQILEPFRCLIGIPQAEHISIYLKGYFESPHVEKLQECFAHSLSLPAKTSLISIQHLQVSKDSIQSFTACLDVFPENNRVVLLTHASEEFKELVFSNQLLPKDLFFSTMEEALNRIAFRSLKW